MEKQTLHDMMSWPNFDAHIIADERVYTVVAGMLTKVNLIKIAYTRNRDKQRYDMLIYFAYASGGGREEDVKTSLDEFYDSVEDYCHGLPAKTVNFFSARIADDVLADMGGYACYGIYHTFRDGDAVREAFTFDNFEFDYETYGFRCDKVPEKIYTSREECLEFNTVLVHEGGKVRLRRGLYKKLMLDERQKQAVDNLLDAVKRCHDNEVEVYLDYDGLMHAFSTRDIDSYEMSTTPVDGKREVKTRSCRFSVADLMPVYHNSAKLYITEKEGENGEL